MRSVVSSVKNLEYLTLEFIRQGDIQKIYSDLKAACDSGRIDQLELSLPDGQFNEEAEIDMRRLADLRPLCALRNTHIRMGDNLFPIRNMFNLQRLKLNLRFRGYQMIQIADMLSKLPNLVELEIFFYWEGNVVSNMFYAFFLPFVQKSPKMKTLKINEPGDWNSADVTRLEAFRSAVPGSVPLTIHISAGKRYKRYVTMLRNTKVTEMVKIKIRKQL